MITIEDSQLRVSAYPQQGNGSRLTATNDWTRRGVHLKKTLSKEVDGTP